MLPFPDPARYIQPIKAVEITAYRFESNHDRTFPPSIRPDAALPGGISPLTLGRKKI